MAERQSPIIKIKLTLPRRESGDFSCFFPNRRSRHPLVARSFFIPFYFPTRRVGCSSVNGSKRRRVDTSTETVKLPALFLTFRPRRKSASRRCAQFFQNSFEFSLAPDCKTWKIGQRRRIATPFLRVFLPSIRRMANFRALNFRCKKHNARTMGTNLKYSRLFDMRLLQVSVGGPLHSRLN